MDREGDAILDAYFSHQLSNVRFNSALFDTQGGANFFIRTSSYQHLKNFFLAVGEGDAAGWEDAAGRSADALDERRKHAARSPHRTLMDDAKGLDELGRGSGFVNISFGTGGDGFENAFVVHTGTGDDDSQVRANGFHASHNVVEVLPATVAEEYEIDGFQLAQIGERGGDQLKIRLGIEERTEPYETQWITFHHGNTNQRFSGYGRFHQDFPVRIASYKSLPDPARN